MSSVKPDVVALLETMEVVNMAASVGLWRQGTWLSFGPDNMGSLEWQGESFCGTAGCFAGWRAILDGARSCRAVHVTVIGPDVGYSHPYLDYVVFPDGSRTRVGDIGQWARRRFGITDDDAQRLFKGNNSLEDLERIVGEIVADAITKEQLPTAEPVGVTQ